MKVHKTKDGYQIVERQVTVFDILDPAGKVYDRHASLADARSEFATAIADDKAMKKYEAAGRPDGPGPAGLAQMFPLGR